MASRIRITWVFEQLSQNDRNTSMFNERRITFFLKPTFVLGFDLLRLFRSHAPVPSTPAIADQLHVRDKQSLRLFKLMRALYPMPCSRLLVVAPRRVADVVGRPRTQAASGLVSFGGRLRSCQSVGAAAHVRPQVVLVSGGVESSVLLRDVARRAQGSVCHRRIVPLHVAYAQRAAREERAAAALQVNATAADPHVVGNPLVSFDPLMDVDLSALGSSLRERAPAHRRAHVPVPHRNLALLAVAVSVCAQLVDGEADGADLYIALSADDAHWYPSATPAFVDAFRALVATLDDRLVIHTPLAHMSKTEIVCLGSELGVSWQHSYSCMLGSPSLINELDGRARQSARDQPFEHCGRCSQCRARKQAFLQGGVADGAHGVYRR
jgi:7-cyano-7-deazaguanine synthase